METTEKPNKEAFDQWHDDPDNWIWEVFYYNKKDKRVFPPKRVRAFGWTVNFANPYSYLTLLGIIAITIIITKFLK